MVTQAILGRRPNDFSADRADAGAGNLGLRYDPSPPLCQKTLFLRNKAVAVGIIVICIVTVTVLVAWQAYEISWCHSGLLSPVKCNHLPDKIGGYLFVIFFPGTAYLVVICLPALLLMGIAEWITRRKYRTFLTGNATG